MKKKDKNDVIKSKNEMNKDKVGVFETIYKGMH